MRVAIGGFTHETNTFHPQPTTLADFQGPAGTWLHGDDIVTGFGGTRSVLGGMLDTGRELGWTLLPTFFANHPPTTGLIAADAFDAIRDNLVAALTAAGAARLATSQKADREAQLARKNGAKTARKDDTRAARKAATKGGAQAAGTGRRKGRKARGPVATFVGDTIASSFWLTAAVGLLLFAFADQEQRERVINGARTFFEQATELYRDFQGYSEEM